MRSKAVAVGLGLLGGAVALGAASRTWSTRVVPGLPEAAATELTGRDVVPAVPALALVVLAAAVVLGTAARGVRPVAAVTLGLAGAGCAAIALGPLTEGTSTGWAVVTVAAGLLTLAGGMLGLVRGRSWSVPAARFERDARQDEAGAALDTDTWARLSRGDDPT